MVSDILEDTIVKLIYPINNDKYFDGNFESDEGNYSFLLPIKTAFFDYFDPEYLYETRMYDGKPSFEMEERGESGVKVTVRIKTVEDYIEFSRIYMSPITTGYIPPNLERNEGGMKEVLLGINIFPFVQQKDPNISNNYRIHVVDVERNYEKVVSNLSFYSNDKGKCEITSAQNRSTFEQGEYNSRTYILEDYFDYIQLSHDGTSGVVIPLFPPPKAGNKKFNFAIDFGTTNTHIEYCEEGEIPKPFEITFSKAQTGTLYDYSFIESFAGEGRLNLSKSLWNEFLPVEISKQKPYRFPTRTAIIENENIIASKSTYTLADLIFRFSMKKMCRIDKILSPQI